MIYTPAAEQAEIRQGDIFFGVPRLEFSMETVWVVGDVSAESRTWGAILSSSKEAEVVVPVTAVTAIVITQDCDAVRSEFLSLCEIVPFAEAEASAKNKTSPDELQKIITQKARQKSKWFYLPPDPACGFTEKMAVDFRATLSLRRSDLEGYRYLRKCRLNEVAYDHFRERLSEFFRRYAYDEWYSLNKEELEKYQKGRDPVKKFKWQE